jgi:amylosucrase
VQNIRLYTPDARRHYEALLPVIDPILSDMSARDKQLFSLRLERYFQNLYDGLSPVYGRRPDFNDFLETLVSKMARCYVERPDDLKALDIERDLTPDWFQRESMLGYVFYVERFAGTLSGITDKLDYLEELGASYLHLMQVVRAREGENDGGYAVLDYQDVEPALGSVTDLEALCKLLRERSVSVCIDLVLNHCAKEHVWAQRARAGDPDYQDYFYMFPDRTMPDEYEKTLPEVFPDFAPGSFTYYTDIDKWVWTTFNEYQWDLNWSNPQVFLEIADIMFYWANKGVEIFRLDAVAFMWKRLGTNSQNQLEVYDLLQALRSCSRIATPAVAHKAEAIVSPQDLIRYFGVGRHHGKVSNIAYHNSLMVQYWSALASRDTRLMTHTLREFPRTPSSIAWGTYIRCHDDIGWAVTDEDAAAIGLNGFLHRKFLSDFYSGDFPGSHALGAVFQYNPATEDKRISGTFASLAGLEKALETRDERLIALSIERILMGHALIAGFGGLPLIYMGDEIGLTNDYGYVKNPLLAGDNRWLHRPYMDWQAAERRSQPDTVEGRLYGGLQKIIRARKRTPHLNSSYDTEVIDSGHPHLFVYERRHPLGNLLAIYNFTESVQTLGVGLLHRYGLYEAFDQLEQRFVDIQDGQVRLLPYGRLWLI